MIPQFENVYATPEEIALYADIPEDGTVEVVGNRWQYYVAFAIFIGSVLIFFKLRK